jgi:copper chaperone
MRTQVLKIAGMTCNHCIMHVKQGLIRLSDTRVEDVQIGSARVEYDETKVGMEDFKRVIEEAGYSLVV